MTAKPKHSQHTRNALPTFLDHVRELQGRLFIVVLAIILAAAAAYPFFGKISELLLAPLEGKQELVYLTPAGAFSYIIMVCVYIGVIAALPVMVFQIYRFLIPVIGAVKLRTVLLYTISSLFLAAGGVAFAYFVSLPASLYFLTNLNLEHINPMLTIDSYFSFVLTFFVAGAVLFQLPLVMLIINRATPLTPKKLMSYQRHLLVGSFVIAAVISPTPDALNQTLLASPMVVMYQVGIALVWLVNRRSSKSHSTVACIEPVPAAISSTAAALPMPSRQVRTVMSDVRPVVAAPLPRPVHVVPRRTLDGFRPASQPSSRHMATGVRQGRQLMHETPYRQFGGSIDGMVGTRRVARS